VADIKLISHRISGRNVSSPDKLFSAAKRELWPATEGIIRKLNDEIIPALNAYQNEAQFLLSFESEDDVTVSQKCEEVTYGVAVASSNPRTTVYAMKFSGGLNTFHLFDPSASGPSDLHWMSHAGSLVGVVLSWDNVGLGPGLTVVGFHLNGEVVASKSVSVNMATGQIGYVFDFSSLGASWSAGDSIGFSMTPHNGANSYNVTVEMELIPS
jgi:hypothetical protein